MFPGSASRQSSKCIFLHFEGKMLTMIIDNHSCEHVLNWITQARKGDSKIIPITHKCPAVLQGVAGLRESEQ